MEPREEVNAPKSLEDSSGAENPPGNTGEQLVTGAVSSSRSLSQSSSGASMPTDTRFARQDPLGRD